MVGVRCRFFEVIFDLSRARGIPTLAYCAGWYVLSCLDRERHGGGGEEVSRMGSGVEEIHSNGLEIALLCVSNKRRRFSKTLRIHIIYD